MKTCFKCGISKEADAFYPHPAMSSGTLNKCKDCTKSDAAERYLLVRLNPVWLAKERARCRAKQERYRKAGLAKPTSPATRSKWAETNKHKIMAQRKVQQARRSGKLFQPDKCSNCGKTGCGLEAHHPDYMRPLNVQWLCTTCHGITRRKESCEIVP